MFALIAVGGALGLHTAANASTRTPRLARPALVSGGANRIVGANGGPLTVVIHLAHVSSCQATAIPHLVLQLGRATACHTGTLRLSTHIPANTSTKVRSYWVTVHLRGAGGSAARTFGIVEAGVPGVVRSSSPTPVRTSSTTVSTLTVITNSTASTVGHPGSSSGATAVTPTTVASPPPPPPAMSASIQCPATAPSTGGSTPASAGYCAGIAFGTYGNTFWGDCTLASGADLDQAFNAELGGSAAALDSNAVIQLYQEMSGATTDNPNIPMANRTAMQQWMTGGIAGSQINNWTTLPVTNDVVIERAVWELGGLYTAVNLPSADLSSPPGTVWNLTQTPPSSPSAESHAMALVGYDASNVYFVDFGQLQAATWGWWNTFATAAVGVLPNEFVAAGHGPVTTTTAMKAAFFNPPTQ